MDNYKVAWYSNKPNEIMSTIEKEFLFKPLEITMFFPNSLEYARYSGVLQSAMYRSEEGNLVKRIDDSFHGDVDSFEGELLLKFENLELTLFGHDLLLNREVSIEPRKMEKYCLSGADGTYVEIKKQKDITSTFEEISARSLN